MYTCISFYFHTFELSFMVLLATFSQRISVINRLTLFNCLCTAIFNKSVSNYATNYIYEEQMLNRRVECLHAVHL